jgi:hypothetical protein
MTDDPAASAWRPESKCRILALLWAAVVIILLTPVSFNI